MQLVADERKNTFKEENERSITGESFIGEIVKERSLDTAAGENGRGEARSQGVPSSLPYTNQSKKPDNLLLGEPIIKHRKNCVCCPCHSLFKGHKVIVYIVFSIVSNAISVSSVKCQVTTIVMKNCHQKCHQQMSSKIVIDNCHQLARTIGEDNWCGQNFENKMLRTQC